MNPAKPTRRPSRNGIRQPHVSKASADIVEASSVPVAEPSKMPPTAPQPAMAPMKPRRPGGARSTMKTIDVVYSPPTERPWIMRNRVSRIGAAIPST